MIVDDLKKSILKQAFSNGFNNYNFEEKKFKDVFTIINGFTPLRSDTSLWSKDEINWFTVDDYNEQGYIINYTNQHISNKAVGENSLRILPTGTVFYVVQALQLVHLLFAIFHLLQISSLMD